MVSYLYERVYGRVCHMCGGPRRACGAVLSPSIVGPRYGIWVNKVGGKCHPLSYLVTVGIIFNIYYWLIFSFFTYVFLSLCACVCSCKGACVGAHVWTCVWRPEFNLCSYFLGDRCLVFKDRVFHWTGSHQAGCSVSPRPLSLGWDRSMNYQTQAFSTWALGVNPRPYACKARTLSIKLYPHWFVIST